MEEEFKELLVEAKVHLVNTVSELQDILDYKSVNIIDQLESIIEDLRSITKKIINIQKKYAEEIKNTGDSNE